MIILKKAYSIPLAFICASHGIHNIFISRYLQGFYSATLNSHNLVFLFSLFCAKMRFDSCRIEWIVILLSYCGFVLLLITSVYPTTAILKKKTLKENLTTKNKTKNIQTNQNQNKTKQNQNENKMLT